MVVNPTRYFTGKPCKHGHVAERQVANRTCVACIETRAAANPEWFRRHDRVRQQDPARRAQKAASERKCRQTDERKAKRAAERRARQAALLQRVPSWADLSAIKPVYAKARRLTIETGVPHHVDHILPLCGELVSGLHIAANLQIITAQENLSKGARLH